MTETVDACIIAALETKLAEAERTADRWRTEATIVREANERFRAALEIATKRAARAEARLATAHDALHDCGFLGGKSS